MPRHDTEYIMVSTDTDITVINRALALFGGGSIQNADENSDLAATCSGIYYPQRDFLLSIHPWRFAMAKRSLNKIAAFEPLNEWEHAHQLPSDMLSGPWAVFGDGSELPSHCFELYDGKLYSDYDEIIIDYSRNVPEGEWPPWFSKFVATAVGGELAMPVSDQVSKGNALLQRAFGTPGAQGRGGLFAECRRLDGQTQATKTLFKNGDPLTKARFGALYPPVEGK